MLNHPHIQNLRNPNIHKSAHQKIHSPSQNDLSPSHSKALITSAPFFTQKSLIFSLLKSR